MVASDDLPASAPSVVAPFVGSRRLCVAPMMDWTDKYDRYFLRKMSKHTWLYTEMVTSGAIIHGDQDRHLRFDPSEHPIAVQLGGSDPADLAKCAAIAEGYGYDEINLNVGCPSERVSSGSFGACLMAEPELVAECVAAMVAAVKIPVTVKHRIGIDQMQVRVPVNKNPKPETCNPETRNPKPETRSPKPETRNPKPETRNPKPETRNPKPETRNPKPETLNPKP